MQDCVTHGMDLEEQLQRLTSSYAGAQASLETCFNLLGEDQSTAGAFGAVAAAMAAVDLARFWWRRHHGTTGPLFPLDRLVILPT